MLNHAKNFKFGGKIRIFYRFFKIDYTKNLLFKSVKEVAEKAKNDAVFFVKW